MKKKDSGAVAVMVFIVIAIGIIWLIGAEIDLDNDTVLEKKCVADNSNFKIFQEVSEHGPHRLIIDTYLHFTSGYIKGRKYRYQKVIDRWVSLGEIKVHLQEEKDRATAGYFNTIDREADQRHYQKWWRTEK